MDSISAKYFSQNVDALISENLNQLYTYLHTIENLLSVKKKFNAVDPLFMEYIGKITELHYMLKTGRQCDVNQIVNQKVKLCVKPGVKPACNTSDSDVDQNVDEDICLTSDTSPLIKKPSTATIVNAMDEADLQLDTHMSHRRKEYENSIINAPVPKTPIKWLTDSEPDIAARTVDRTEYPLAESSDKSTDKVEDFEVVEETQATATDIIAAIEARREEAHQTAQALTQAEPVVAVSAPVEAAEKPKSLSAITAERLGVHFCTPDDEPATVNALFKIGPKHRDMLYTKLYTKAKANISLLNPDPAKFDELVRLETDHLLNKWIAAH
jgi:hypothetical protein